MAHPQPDSGGSLGKLRNRQTGNHQAEVKALDDANQLPGENHRQQRVRYLSQRNVAQRQAQHNQVREQVDPLNWQTRDAAQGHRKRIISAGRTAIADTDARAEAHEQRADKRRDKLGGNQQREHRREWFQQRIHRGITQARDGRVQQESAAERPPAQRVAQDVQNQRRKRGGDGEQMLQQQRQSQHATLRNAGMRVNVAHAHRKDGTAQDHHGG